MVECKLMSGKIIIHDKNNREIWCYGEVVEDSNFSLVCDNEWDDTIVPGLEDEEGNPPKTWQQVVDILFKSGFNELEEISTC